MFNVSIRDSIAAKSSLGGAKRGVPGGPHAAASTQLAGLGAPGHDDHSVQPLDGPPMAQAGRGETG